MNSFRLVLEGKVGKEILFANTAFSKIPFPHHFFGKINFMPFWSPLESKKFTTCLLQISSSLVLPLLTIQLVTPKSTGTPSKTICMTMYYIIKCRHLFRRFCVTLNRISDLVKQNQKSCVFKQEIF